MNDQIGNNVQRQQQEEQHLCCCFWTCKPIPSLAIYILVTLFVLSLSFSLLILAVIHNVLLLLSILLLFALALAFLLWNTFNYRRNAAVLLYLRSFPHTDLTLATEGQLVKVTGLVSCGSVSLESSYEKVPRCIYASTLLYEYKQIDLNSWNSSKSCFHWSLLYSERISTDFYITDQKSGIRVLVKAGPCSKVTPLVVESTLVSTTRKCKILSPHFSKWLRDRNLSAEARLLRLEEGYVKEGTIATVFGVLRRNNDIFMIVQPPEPISTGCLWQKLLSPVDVDGLILGVT